MRPFTGERYPSNGCNRPVHLSGVGAGRTDGRVGSILWTHAGDARGHPGERTDRPELVVTPFGRTARPRSMPATAAQLGWLHAVDERVRAIVGLLGPAGAGRSRTAG